MFNTKENCKAIKARFKQLFADITEEDLQCNEQNKEEMMTRLQQKLGKSGDELFELIVNLDMVSKADVQERSFSGNH
jgi:hypothetical protein